MAAGDPYRPESGIEGMGFLEAYCRSCKREADCAIPFLAMLFAPGHEGYPKEWICGDDGAPTCTGFIHIRNQGGVR